MKIELEFPGFDWVRGANEIILNSITNRFDSLIMNRSVTGCPFRPAFENKNGSVKWLLQLKKKSRIAIRLKGILRS